MSELLEIKTKLDVIDKRIGKLLEWKAASTEREKTITRDVTEMRSTLFSKNGVVPKVSRLWDLRLGIAQCNNWRIFWLFVLKTVTAGVVLGIVCFLLKVYKWLPQ